jgi:D-glycero-D-manno-heptose 1,7-bisphosphate phosphatase
VCGATRSVVCSRAVSTRPRAVLFDRDGTLVVDVPYNGDPDAVRTMPGAAAALGRVRADGVPVGVVSNQSGIARGLLDAGQVEAVNARVAELLGPFAVWRWCPHGADDGCVCRKPRPGMVLGAAAALGVAATEVAVIGDIAADVGAADAAGARAVLVPTPATRREEIEDAAARGILADDLLGAVALLGFTPTGSAP